MKYRLLVFLLFSTLSLPMVAQNWIEDNEGDVEFDCDVINAIIEQFGTEEIARSKGETVDTATYFSELVDCSEEALDESLSINNALFNVVVIGDVNLRSCGDIKCKVVGLAKDKTVLAVIKEEFDWYVVDNGGQDAYIASWLTEEGPAAVLKTGDPYTIRENSCEILPDIKRGENVVTVIITGERIDDIRVDLYRPVEEYPLKVYAQYDKTFIDTGDFYIHQLYRSNTSFPTGLYYIDVNLDDVVTRVAWDRVERGEHSIYVQCDE